MRIIAGIVVVIVGGLFLMFLSTQGMFETVGIRLFGTHQSVGRETFTSLSSTFGQICGLREEGSVVCWGLGEPEFPLPDEPLMSIGISDSHICGLREDGSAACWGADRWGQSTPPADERFTSLSVGPELSCGLREDGVPVCWGSKQYGRRDLPPDERFALITVGGTYVCGLYEDGMAVCWGQTLYYSYTRDRGTGKPIGASSFQHSFFDH